MKSLTKIELKKRVKSILHDEKNFKTRLSNDDFNLLEKLFKFYYDNFYNEKYTFIWDDNVSLIDVRIQKTFPYRNTAFFLYFSNGLSENPSYTKAIQSLSKEQVYEIKEYLK